MKNILLPVCVFLCLLFSACKSLTGVDEVILADPEYAIPVANTSTSLKKLLDGFDKNAALQIKQDGNMALHYKGTFIVKNTTDFLNFLQNIPVQCTDTVQAVPFRLPSGVHVDYVYLKSGGSTGIFVSKRNQTMRLTVRIPEVTKNGIPYSKTIDIPANTVASTSLFGGAVDEYIINTVSDSIHIIYDARLANGTRIKLDPTQGESFLFAFSNLNFHFLKGFLGKSEILLPEDTIRINFFDKYQQGNLRFYEPTMTITLDNSFGVPVKSNVTIARVLSRDGRSLNFRSPLITNGVTVNYPSLSEIGQSKRTVITLDKGNSNIDSIINLNPIAIDYKIDGIMNPDSLNNVVGFLTDSSSYKLQVEADLPMYLTAKKFAITDTTNVSLGSSTSTNNIDHVELKIITDNYMPIDLGVQGYFLDAYGGLLDSLYSSSTALDSLNSTGRIILKSAPVDGMGNAMGKTNQISYITLNATRYARIKPATQLALKYTFSTANSGIAPVRILATQGVDIKIGMKIGLKR
jgi:hypothetical protein